MNVIVLDDSSDDDSAPSRATRPDAAKKRRRRAISSDDHEGDSDDTMPRRPTARKRKAIASDEEEDSDFGARQLTSRSAHATPEKPSSSRRSMFNETVSFIELQAQQHELERLKHRKQQATHAAARSKAKSPASSTKRSSTIAPRRQLPIKTCRKSAPTNSKRLPFPRSGSNPLSDDDATGSDEESAAFRSEASRPKDTNAARSSADGDAIDSDEDDASHWAPPPKPRKALASKSARKAAPGGPRLPIPRKQLATMSARKVAPTDARLPIPPTSSKPPTLQELHLVLKRQAAKDRKLAAKEMKRQQTQVCKKSASTGKKRLPIPRSTKEDGDDDNEEDNEDTEDEEGDALDKYLGETNAARKDTMVCKKSAPSLPWLPIPRSSPPRSEDNDDDEEEEKPLAKNSEKKVSKVCKKSAPSSSRSFKPRPSPPLSDDGDEEVSKIEVKPERPHRTRNATPIDPIASMTVGELQAQERAFAKLEAQMKGAHPAATASERNPSASDAAEKAVGVKKEPANAMEDAKDDLSTEEIDDEENDDDEDDETYESNKSNRKQKNSTPKKGAKKSRSGIKKETAATGKHKKRDNTTNGSTGPVNMQAPAVVTDVLGAARTRVDTVIHSTSWRGVAFEEAPVNILSVAVPLFSSTYDKPLTTFDNEGELAVKCKIVASFGKAKRLIPTILAVDNQETVTQEDTDKKVTKSMESILPKIRACYSRKTQSIISEARTHVAQCLEVHKALAKERRVGSLNPIKLEVALTERAIADELRKCPPVPIEQVNKMKFRISNGMTVTTERQILPNDVFETRPLRGLSKSTAYVGLKRSVRVDDDPILRYVPYFGDNDSGEVIDVKQYDGIKRKEASQISALDGEVNEYLLRALVAECGDSDKVFNSLNTVAGFPQAYSDYSEIKKLHDSRRTASSRLHETKNAIRSLDHDMEESKQDGEAAAVASSTVGALAKLAEVNPLLDIRDNEGAPSSLAERFAPPPTYFESNLLRGHLSKANSLGLRPTKDYAELSVTYRDLFCRMCYQYDCHDHGIEHPMPASRTDPVFPTLRLAPSMLALSAKEEPETEINEVQDESMLVDEESATESTQDNDKDMSTVDEQLPSLKSDDTISVEEDDDVSVGDSLASQEQERRRSSRSSTVLSTKARKSEDAQGARSDRGSRPSRPSRAKEKVLKPKDESEFLDDSHYEQVTEMLQTFLAPDTPCSAQCWKSGPVLASAPEEESKTEDVKLDSLNEDVDQPQLSPVESLLLQKVRYTVGDNPCMIASIVKSTPCSTIHAVLAREKKQQQARHDSLEFSPDARAKKARKRGGRNLGSRAAGNNRELLKRTRNNRLKDKGSNHEYEPCNHDGMVCDSTGCSCMKRDHMCEKACSCSRDCPNRFQGCKCSMGNCRTNACPCFVALRECNPDLCFTCGASEVPTLNYSDLAHRSSMELGVCCNMNITRGLHKKIGVAFSTTHGWGAFAREPIRRGEFIYEYTGAMISQDEAERRGSIYDKMTISFLFDCNEDAVVDAIRKGNKSKFANHSSVGTKCRAKILRVGGEHRIAIWAQQDIAKGEELFFDYGYHGESAPDWSQVRISGSRSNPQQSGEDA